MIVAVVAAVVMCCCGGLNSCGSDDDDGSGDGRSERCQDLDEWFADNPHDTNPQLNDEYNANCGGNR